MFTNPALLSIAHFSRLNDELKYFLDWMTAYRTGVKQLVIFYEIRFAIIHVTRTVQGGVGHFSKMNLKDRKYYDT